MGSFKEEKIHVPDIASTMSKSENEDQCPEVRPLAFLEKVIQIPEKILESFWYITDNEHWPFLRSHFFVITVLIGTKGFFL